MGIRESPKKAANGFQAKNQLVMVTKRHRTGEQSTTVANNEGVLKVV